MFIKIKSFKIHEITVAPVQRPIECDKQQERISCPDGTRTQKVTRWFRPVGSLPYYTLAHPEMAKYAKLEDIPLLRDPKIRKCRKMRRGANLMSMITVTMKTYP